ncbi:hypothetical protein HYALB_00005917 [Hymenoscyphus albidus]|uniref:Xylanolytic transcriptional activator regulatory domain-containing protein n=1 Tax=Hymenoscyphus albidus TaxID=595503 RepID=A0A9N9Q8W9_9HELO|nr:hypothetical protein HYALB_00005917 [Hymenoscyphus albidus]
MNKPSVRSVQAMVLITYFLINDNHASDGWAFSGILTRQAYALGLHRDPNIVVANATSFEKQSRLKLWQAVLLQDTFLTVLLSLPPSATHTDVSVTSLFTDDTSSTDTAYINLSWRLAYLVQHSVSTPRQNKAPPTIPRNPHPLSPQIPHQATRTPLRTLRQTLFLTSNYHHNIMLLHSSSSLQVAMDIPGALDAAHFAIHAFFKLWEVFRAEAKVWWVFHHRAFLEALCIGGILKGDDEDSRNPRLAEDDPFFVRGREDIVRMIDIMRQMSEGEHGSKVALTRISVLSAYI